MYYTDEMVEQIKSYLIENPKYFCKKTCVSIISEVIKFKMTNPHPIIFFGDYFLCDIYSNEIWIVKLCQKKEWDTQRKQWLNVKAIAKVISCLDEHGKSRFYMFNGYWKIPNFNDKPQPQGKRSFRMIDKGKVDIVVDISFKKLIDIDNPSNCYARFPLDMEDVFIWHSINYLNRYYNAGVKAGKKLALLEVEKAINTLKVII